MNQIDRQHILGYGLHKLPVEATAGLQDGSRVHRSVRLPAAAIQIAMADERCSASTVDPFMRLVGGLVPVRVVEDQSVVEQAVSRQRHSVEQGNERATFCLLWRQNDLADFIIGKRFRAIVIRYGGRTLSSGPGMHQVLTLKQADVTEGFGIRNNRLHLRSRYASENRVIGDIGNDALSDNLAFQGFDDVTQAIFGLLPALHGPSKPQLGLEWNFVLFKLQTLSPILQDSRLPNPILDSPRPYGI